MSKLNTLQAFRCIGLTGVVIGHMTFAEEKYAGATLLPVEIKDFNQLFIDWFFVVSGFIMVMVSRGRFQVPKEIAKFAYARVARIYPPYWVYFFITLAVFLIMPQWINSAHGEPNLWKSFFLVPDKNLPLVMVAWSLVFEMWFYLVFTSLMLFRERYLPWILASWAGLIICANLAFDTSSLNPVLRLILHPYAIEFVMGSLIALFYFSSLSERVSTQVAIGMLLFVPLIGVPVGYNLGLFRGEGLVRVFSLGTLFGLLTIGATLLERRDKLSVPNFMVAIGDSSYTTYLSHLLVIGVIGKLWVVFELASPSLMGNIAFLVIMFAAVMIYGLVGFRLIEEPLMNAANNLGKKIFKKKPAANSATLAAKHAE
ncbi:peptidoglycan/LPS O-acetylase OafA/YrhL [Ectopseudomonas oleovorans]|uniref:Peptidoglycan/LPS O-acetylase OafA/YrhL n=1 Tax=Ectopseudomonas oleovorans TaxID=301 RepID=A0A397MI48_ECTOL|nr:acyltransferase [Pseudomonas oleovorans]RIA21254.1 peptidoglycan/LPS O-acetylase OafA/YrhL [Pseudomonas oleovorans]